ncbi:hypothetical protein TNCV_2000701 [Trichonephila clavipes]|nr:hypothetical protein TNCV_2000701 [Trichonephila clavipes]
MTPDVGPECLARRKFVCRRFSGLLLTNTRHQVRTSFHKKAQQISTPTSNDLWLDTTAIANGNGLYSVEYMLQDVWLLAVLEITNLLQLVESRWYPNAVQITTVDAVQCATTVRRIRWSALSVVPRGHLNPIFLI